MAPKLPPGLRQRRWKDGSIVFQGRFMHRGVHHIRTFGTNRRSAIRMYEEWKRQIRERALGIIGDDEDVPMGALRPIMAAYGADLRSRAKVDHARKSEATVKRVVDELGAKNVRDLDVAAISRWRASRQDEGLSRRTINLSVGYVRAMLRWAVEARMAPVNPLRDLKRLPESKATEVVRRHRLTEKEAAKLVKAARKLDTVRPKGGPRRRVPQAPLIELLLETGMRWSEATSLRWADLEARDDGAWLIIRASTSKNAEARACPIRAPMLARLRELRATQGAALGRLPADDDRILCSTTGLPWSSNNRHTAYRFLRAAAKAAGFEFKDKRSLTLKSGARLDYHALRHSFCTLGRERGIDVGDMQALMGHRDISVTSRIYTDAERTRKREALERMPDAADWSRLGPEDGDARKSRG